MFRIIVQDSRKSPSSGKIVASLGNYDPHSKKVDLDKEKATTYLKNGAQPSGRIATILKSEGIKLPSWVSVSTAKKRTVRNTEKRRSTATAKPEEEASETTEAPEASETSSESAEAEVATTDTEHSEQSDEKVEEPKEVSESSEAEEASAEKEPEAPKES